MNEVTRSEYKGGYIYHVVICLAVVLGGCCKTEKEQVGPTPDSISVYTNLALTTDQVRAVTPVLESLASALAQIAPKYVELSSFKKEDAIHQSGISIGLEYNYNFQPPTAKRGVRLTDFGKQGLHVNFSFAPMPPPKVPNYSMSPPTRTLRNLRLYLWEEVLAAPDASQKAVKEIREILGTYSNKIVEIDKMSR